MMFNAAALRRAATLAVTRHARTLRAPVPASRSASALAGTLHPSAAPLPPFPRLPSIYTRSDNGTPAAPPSSASGGTDGAAPPANSDGDDPNDPKSGARPTPVTVSRANGRRNGRGIRAATRVPTTDNDATVRASGTASATPDDDGGNGIPPTPPSSSGNNNGNTGHPSHLQTLTPPDPYSPLLALPITRRPLFPGFYKTVVIKDPEVIRAIKDLAESRQPYVAAVLLKDEEADTDRIQSLDEIHHVGVFSQITNVYHTSPTGPGDDAPSLTAILYPHRRVRISGLVNDSDAASTTATAAPASTTDGDAVTKPVTAPDAAIVADADKPATTSEPSGSPQSYLRSKYDVSVVHAETLHDEPYKKGNQLVRAITAEIVNVFKDIASLNPLFREQISAFSVSQASTTIFDDPSKLADFAAAVSGGSDSEELQGVLESLVIEERLQKALYVLKKELVNAQLQSKISKEVESKIQKRQREYYLMEQLKGIKKELGMESDGKDKLLEKFKERIQHATLPAAVATVIEEEMQKLGHLDPASSEFNVTRNYLDWLTCLPWGKYSQEVLDVEHAQQCLDEDHYGLKDVKERILEFIAVGKLKGTVEGKIMCLSGPPGVGKTSIGKSIARALGREFYRFSVGGLSDVAEIKGHRRTYVGAMPGKLVQALKKVQTENPLVLIDEIDKLGRGLQGDPASALLELLDPEQNSSFLDHYLDVPLDLSKVLFVCTANVLDTIPGPLLDRMEVIQLSGYVADEKVAIAEKYLAPQARIACGLEAPPVPKEDAAKTAETAPGATESAASELTAAEAVPSAASSGSSATESISATAATADATSAESAPVPAPALAVPVPRVDLTREAIEDLIRYYCRESGVRNLKKHIEKVYRKAAFKVVSAGADAEPLSITPANLKDYVGNPPFSGERLFEHPPAGVVMGLAWTAMGGSSLYIESVLEAPLTTESKPALTKTGQLGDVMKESSSIAYTYAKAHLLRHFPQLAQFFQHAAIHLHVPEGATPKDGPSAGITMATSLISLAANTPIPPHIAMTGELTLSGKVLKIGGLKEKTIAAKRSGITTILFPAANAADWAELPDFVKEGIEGRPVEWYSEVFDACFGEAVARGEFAKNAWPIVPAATATAVLADLPSAAAGATASSVSIGA
ncbi:ATP-dependent Lon protease pim1 [Allomyces arbusculus]|nr:ATP-dependent Lon protease pim1 [Allomyces arbusculus]